MTNLHRPTESAELLSVPQAASRLNVHEDTVWRKVWLGEIKVVRIGRLVRIDKQDLDAFIRDHKILWRGESS